MILSIANTTAIKECITPDMYDPALETEEEHIGALCYHNKMTLGYVLFREDGTLLAAVVHPDVRRKGIGTQVYTFAEEFVGGIYSNTLRAQVNHEDPFLLAMGYSYSPEEGCMIKTYKES